MTQVSNTAKRYFQVDSGFEEPFYEMSVAVHSALHLFGQPCPLHRPTTIIGATLTYYK